MTTSKTMLEDLTTHLLEEVTTTVLRHFRIMMAAGLSSGEGSACLMAAMEDLMAKAIEITTAGVIEARRVEAMESTIDRLAAHLRRRQPDMLAAIATSARKFR